MKPLRPRDAGSARRFGRADRSPGDNTVSRAFDPSGPIAGLATLLMDDEPLPGGIVIAADRSGVTGALPFGHADAERRRPVTPDDLFEIGSISKYVVSAAMANLADRGLLRLDEPVTTYLPWWCAGPYSERISLAHLLGHTAGLVAGVEGLVDEPAQAWALRDRATFEPGTRFYYSNIGFVTLGLVIEAVTGRPLAETLYREVLEPIGAATGIAAIRDADRPRLAIGYAPAAADRPWLPGDRVAPATWLEATAGDGCVALDAAGTAGLLRLLLGDGAVGDRRVLPPAGAERIRRCLAPGGESIQGADVGLPVTESRYGLGINVETIGGATCLTHGGGMVGYASFVLADPSADVAVAVLTNANGDCLAAQYLARYVHRLLVTGEAPAPRSLTTSRARRAALRGDETPDPGDGAALRDVAVSDGDGRDGASGTVTDGSIAGTDDEGREISVRIERDPATGLLRCLALGEVGMVYEDLYGRWATDHPALRRAHLHRAAAPVTDIAWGAGVAVQDRPGRSGAALVGDYHAHNPWFPSFRIVRRRAGLFLITTGGVEAPTEDEPLVPLGDGVYRLGAEEWRPERIREVARIGGRVVILDRDGCRYSSSDPW